MNIPRITIPDELFAPAESATFSGEYDLPSLTLGSDTYTFDHPLTWTVTVSNTGGTFLVTGVVAGDATTTCVRCLDPAHYNLEGEVEGYFVIPGTDVELTEEEQDECEELSEDHIIDLSTLLQAALSLELPTTPLCDDDCKGLCAGCGANLNYEECTCNKTNDEEDDFSQNPFAVLRNISFDKE